MSASAVECYSGHTYAQEPRVVVWHGKRHRVVRVERRWRAPEGPAFRVQAEPGGAFDLLFHETEGRWAVQPQEDWDSADPNEGS